MFLKFQGPNQRLTRLHYKESKDAKINIVNVGEGRVVRGRQMLLAEF